MCNRGNSYREIADWWQHSTSTISEVRNVVSTSVIAVHKIQSFFDIPRQNDPVPSRILTDYRFYPFFDNFIGALDGSHIPAHVSSTERPFRNRKGVMSQNILGVVNFDMMFTFVLVGWEGSAHDGRVLIDGVMKGLHLIPGKYYLGDAGYALTKYCLTPYRGVRYHLKE